jgi:ribosome-associated protein
MSCKRCSQARYCPIFERISSTSTEKRKQLRLNKIQQAAVTALEDIKATDIVPLDTRTLTSLYDAIIVATAESGRQTKALARNVADKVKAAGGHVIAIEGENSGEWVLVDCGELVVHILLPQMRTLYNLEELWTPSPQFKAARAPKAITKSPSKIKPDAPESRANTTKVVATKTASSKSVATSTAKPAAKKPASKAPASKRPAVKKPAARKPAAKAPATKRPAAKKPAAKKPAAKKPAAKPAAKRR